jgi:hypothetical protein
VAFVSDNGQPDQSYFLSCQSVWKDEVESEEKEKEKGRK